MPSRLMPPPLVEWALNTDVATPDNFRDRQIHLLKVLDVTPP
jgi:hypothetical protein